MKSKFWCFIAYPESAPENWKDILSERGLCFAVSPLHDLDINADGSKKKEHWHIILEYPGPTTEKCVSEVAKLVNGTRVFKVENLRGMYRYLAHLDNPEKAQYDIQKVEKYGGFELDLTVTEVNRIIKEILEDVESESIIEYSDLVDLYREIGDNDKFDIVSNHTYFFDKYICSKRNKLKLKKVAPSDRL